jgi:ssDNA-binding Zn-finger/Zn-ribbon topoisomerase 1
MVEGKEKTKRKIVNTEHDKLGRYWTIERTEYTCPKCGKKLLLRTRSAVARNSLAGGYFICAASMARAKLKCPEHGVIPDDELHSDDRDRFKKEKTKAVGCAIGCAAIIIIITFVIIAIISAQ